MDAEEDIYYLNIANQRFVPVTVFCLKSLRDLCVRSTSFFELEVDNDSVRRLSSEIQRLAPSLVTLNIYDTTITHLPEQIGKLTRLYQLQLSNTGLVALPDSIGNLSSLSHLYLSGNKLTSLPTTIANIQVLYSVLLDDNLKLRSLQSLNGLPNLISSYARNSLIERLPLNLPNLYYLYMSNNNLTDLIGTGTLGNKTTLSKHFYFNMNRIQFVPPQIRFVRNLYYLNLDNNELATLRTDIFNLTTLRYLMRCEA
jgi:Leucine-rich repeat (LRR) protein